MIPKSYKTLTITAVNNYLQMQMQMQIPMQTVLTSPPQLIYPVCHNTRNWGHIQSSLKFGTSPGQRVSLQRYERMRVSKTDPHPKNDHGYVRQRRRRLPPALPSGRHSCTPFCVTRSARWSLGFLSIFLFRSPPPFPLYLSP